MNFVFCVFLIFDVISFYPCYANCFGLHRTSCRIWFDHYWELEFDNQLIYESSLLEFSDCLCALWSSRFTWIKLWKRHDRKHVLCYIFLLCFSLLLLWNLGSIFVTTIWSEFWSFVIFFFWLLYPVDICPFVGIFLLYS